jgi:hypothetical protein
MRVAQSFNAELAHVANVASRSIVGNFETAKASDFNKLQQLSTSSLQAVQYQTVVNLRIQQLSIIAGIWFGTRGSEVQILSPRPILSIT